MEILINGHDSGTDFKLEVIGGTYHIFLGLCKGIYPQNMANNMVLTYLHLLDPGDLPLNSREFLGFNVLRHETMVDPRC